MEKYYAVTTSNSNDELKHWKYIKKKKVNGKWKTIARPQKTTYTV